MKNLMKFTKSVTRKSCDTSFNFQSEVKFAQFNNEILKFRVRIGMGEKSGEIHENSDHKRLW